METWKDFDRFAEKRIDNWINRVRIDVHPALWEMACHTIRITLIQEVARRQGEVAVFPTPGVADLSGRIWTYNPEENRFYSGYSWDSQRQEADPDNFVPNRPNQPFSVE